ncbi:MAG: hypothetical protein AB7F32_11245, partial [Victivallaceae bacterium]
DVMQFVVLIGGLFCILGALFLKTDGGMIGGIAYAFKHGRGLDQFVRPEFYLLNPYVRLSFWLLLLGQLLTPIGVMASDQMTVQRLLASGSSKAAVKTQVVNTVLTIPTIVILWVIGLMVFSFFHQHPELVAKSGDTALFSFISTQLPSPIPGLVIAAMMAAVISTLNAVFNSMATLYLKELHLRYFNPAMGEHAQVKMSRIATVAVGVIACALGLLITYSAEWLSQSVVEASTIFYAFEAVVVPAFIFAVLSKRASVLLVWVTAGSLWGLKLGMTVWYSASTMAFNCWKPGQDMGWAGPIGWRSAVPFAVVGIIAMTVWYIRYRRQKKYNTPIIVTGTMFLGFGIAILIWSFFSHIYCREAAHALSFQWLGVPAIVCYVLLGAVWLTCGKVQQKEKYQGLTLFDKGAVLDEKQSQGAISNHVDF